MPRARAASVVLDVVEVLRGYRPTALFLHHARCEFLLAKIECLAGLRNRLAEGHTVRGHGRFIASSPCQSACSRICELLLLIQNGINREAGSRAAGK